MRPEREDSGRGDTHAPGAEEAVRRQGPTPLRMVSRAGIGPHNSSHRAEKGKGCPMAEYRPTRRLFRRLLFMTFFCSGVSVHFRLTCQTRRPVQMPMM